MSNLLLCPFCGEGPPRQVPGWKPQEWRAIQKDSGSWYVGCNACGATGPQYSLAPGLRNTADEAESAWNARLAQYITIEDTAYRLMGDIEVAHRRAMATGERVLLYVSATRTPEAPACPG